MSATPSATTLLIAIFLVGVVGLTVSVQIWAFVRSDRSRIARWALATTGLLTVVWVLSIFFVIRIPGGTWTARVGFGAFDFFTPATQPPGWRVSQFSARPPKAIPSWGSLRGGWFMVVPLWPLIVSLAVAGAYSSWRRRRPRTGHCVTCGYNLKGNVSGVCPECGTAVERPLSEET